MKTKEFRDAVNKGLGRAILTLKKDNKKNKYMKAILYACVHNTAYDPQCESDRTEYLWEVIQQSGNSDYLQDAILIALNEFKESHDTIQMKRLARKFAENGNGKARIALYESFRFDEDYNAFIGDDEIILLDGLSGLIFVAEQVGKRIIAEPDYFETDWTLELAEEKYGKENVEKILRENSKTNDNIRAYIESVYAYRRESITRQSPARKTYDELKIAIENQDELHLHYLYSWGRKAPEEDLIQAASDLLNETDLIKIAKYLDIFRSGKFPLNPDKIIRHAISNNKKISEKAILALRGIRDQSVRNLAVSRLQKEPFCYDSLDLIKMNFELADIPMLENIALKKRNRHLFHSIQRAMNDIFEQNPTKECERILTHLYQVGWCSNCRADSIKILIKCKAIPEWLMEECQYDSNEEIRKIIQEQLMHSA